MTSNFVGDTHPIGSEHCCVRRAIHRATSCTLRLTNSDGVSLVDADTGHALNTVDLSLFPGKPTHGAQPNAITVSS